MIPLDDYRKRPCPNCGRVGVYLDPTSQELRCKYCKLSGLRFEPLTQLEAPKEIVVPRQENVPLIPPNAAPAALINEFYVDENGTRHSVVTYHLPRDFNMKQEDFDSESAWAKIAQIRFAKLAKRRRMLNRAIIRRGKEQGREIGPWSEEWTPEQKALSTFDVDAILEKVGRTLRRKQRKRRRERST